MVSKAVAAAQRYQQKAQAHSEFDPSLLKVLWESDPVEISQRNGVLSVQVYSYNGGEPKVGIYRVGFDPKEGKVFHSKQMCPLNGLQATALAERLAQASVKLAEIQKGK